MMGFHVYFLEQLYRLGGSAQECRYLQVLISFLASNLFLHGWQLQKP